MDVIDISDNEEAGEEGGEDAGAEALIDRRAILTPPITRVVSALGGSEGGVYRLGDECYGCLKDLKRFWRKDDTDDDRTVARIFWKLRVLQNDLVPILLVTTNDSGNGSGSGSAGQDLKCAVACADLITAMTWPIDIASELRELDERADDPGVDYTQLIAAQLAYKHALLKRGVMRALLALALPCLAKTRRERTVRDGQVVSVVLHLVRNLAFIRDPPPNTHLSAEQAEYSSLQSTLIETLAETNITDLLLTLASNATTDPLFNSWNTLLLDIFYLLFRGVKPSSLTTDQSKAPESTLLSLLASEDKHRKQSSRTGTRHSRFGTTIAVRVPSKSGPPPASSSSTPAPSTTQSSAAGTKQYIFHRQDAYKLPAGEALDLTKKKQTRARKKVDELGVQENLSVGARKVLQELARTLVDACFNQFLGSILKDIRSERPKVTEKDNLRLLFLLKWLLEFFLAVRERDSEKSKAAKPTATAADTSGVPATFSFELVAEVVDRSWVAWILRRMRGAMDEKPKQWTELQAGIDCLTQMLLLIDTMSNVHDPMLQETAETLQHQLYYNGEVMDVAFETVRTYKEQSIAYLDSTVHLSYVLLRMLEKWGHTKGEMYIRKRQAKKNRGKGKGMKGKGVPEEEGIVDVADVDEEEAEEAARAEIKEQMFTFEAFEAKFAHEDVTQTLLTYLARFHEFDSPEKLKRVVGLIHRQVVRAKAEGLFFKVSTLHLFKSILAEEQKFPKDQVHKDLLQLINFILRKFFKAVEEEPLLIVEAFYPKNRGQWKQYSSWQPEEKKKLAGGLGGIGTGPSRPAEVQVKKGHSWSQQLAIAIACLLEKDEKELIDWTKVILSTVVAERERIVEEVDGTQGEDGEQGILDDDEEVRRALLLKQPSMEAMGRFTDFTVLYLEHVHAEAATRNPHLKLVFRLAKFRVVNEDAEELEWYIPAAVGPAELRRCLNLVTQFADHPVDLEGKKATQMLSKKRKRTVRTTESDDEAALEFDMERKKKKREAKKKDDKVYKSAQFIEDSDEELARDVDWVEREKVQMEKAEQSALDAENATATKKAVVEIGSGSDEDGVSLAVPAKKSAKPRPKPKPKVAKSAAKKQVTPSPPHSDSDAARNPSPRAAPTRIDSGSEEEGVVRPVRRKRLILSDEDE